MRGGRQSTSLRSLTGSSCTMLRWFMARLKAIWTALRMLDVRPSIILILSMVLSMPRGTILDLGSHCLKTRASELAATATFPPGGRGQGSRRHSPAALVVEKEHEVEFLFCFVLHLLADAEHVRGGRGDGHPVVLAAHSWHVGVDDLCTAGGGGGWLGVLSSWTPGALLRTCGKSTHTCRRAQNFSKTFQGIGVAMLPPSGQNGKQQPAGHKNMNYPGKQT